MSDRWLDFIGTVIEVLTDPLGQGRAKVRVDGVHGPDILDADLPYAEVVLPCTGGTSGIGENAQMLPGARVVGAFTDGELRQSPMVFGCVTQVERSIRPRAFINNESNLTLVTASSKSFQSAETIAFIEMNTPPGGSTEDYRKRLTWEFLQMLHTDYKQHIVAGIMGNLLVESRLNPRKSQDITDAAGNFVEGGGVGRGIAQWSKNERWQDCIAFSKKRSEFDLLIQLEFIHHELTSQEMYSAGGALFRTTDVTEAALLFMRYYERPQIKKTESKYKGFAFDIPNFKIFERAGEAERIREAKQVLADFTQG